MKLVSLISFCMLMKISDANDTTYTPIIEVRQFDYIYEKDDQVPPNYRRIVLLKEDSVQALLKKASSRH